MQNVDELPANDNLSLASKIDAATQEDAQQVNPFSESEPLTQPTLSKGEHGKPGNLTEVSGRKANIILLKEVLELCQIIDAGGYNMKNKPGMKFIPFGELYNIYTYISDRVVAILQRARKHNVIDYEGEVLYQRRDAEVPIYLLKPIKEIRQIMEQKQEVIRKSVSPSPKATALKAKVPRTTSKRLVDSNSGIVKPIAGKTKNVEIVEGANKILDQNDYFEETVPMEDTGVAAAMAIQSSEDFAASLVSARESTLSEDLASTQIESITSEDLVSNQIESIVSDDLASARIESIPSEDLASARTESIPSEDLASARIESIVSEDLASARIESVTSEDLASSRLESIPSEDLASARTESIPSEDLASARIESILSEDLASARIESVTSEELASARIELIASEDLASVQIESMASGELAPGSIELISSHELPPPPIESEISVELSPHPSELISESIEVTSTRREYYANIPTPTESSITLTTGCDSD